MYHFGQDLDVIGLTAYYPLIQEGQKTSFDQLYERWYLIRSSLVDWLANNYPQKQIFFTGAWLSKSNRWFKSTLALFI